MCFSFPEFSNAEGERSLQLTSPPAGEQVAPNSAPRDPSEEGAGAGDGSDGGNEDSEGPVSRLLMGMAE